MRNSLRMKKHLLLISLIIMLSTSASYSQIKKDTNNENDTRKEDNIDKQSGKDEILKLDLEKVLNLVIKNNLDVKKALLDYKASTVELNKYQSKFSYNLFLKPNYSSAESSPDNPSAMFSGTKTNRFNVDTGVSRKLRTGTDITVGISNLYQNISGAEIASNSGTLDLGGKGYQTGLAVSIRQDILKNIFGINDRLTEKIIDNAGKMQKQVVKLYLANLLVEALIGYWNVMVAEENLKTVKSTLESTIKIRNLIKRKQSLGLSEKEELLDWDSKVLQGRNTVELAEKNLYDAKRAVLRTLDLEETTAFDIVKNFKTTEPIVSLEHAIKDAFLKRVDLVNKKTLLKNSEFECEIASNNLDPSLTLNLSAGNVDYSTHYFSSTFNDINKQWSVGFEMKYPLGNKEAKTKLKEAMLNHKKNQIDLKKLEKEIRDEVDSLVKQCDVMFSVYQKTMKSKDYSRRYYTQVLKKFKQGRYDAVTLKLALDNYTSLSHQELKSLVDYNITLLRRDLSRNVIFENYNIDIDSILNKLQ